MTALLALLLLAPAASVAESRAEIFARVGVGVLYEDEGSLGSGLDWGLGFAYRPQPRFGFELEVSRLRHARRPESAFGGFFAEGDATLATGSFLYTFSPESRVRPFVLGGAGFLHYEGATGFEPTRDPLTGQIFTEGVRFEGSDDAFVARFEAGVEVRVSRWISIEPEFRLLLSTGTRFVEAPFSWFGAGVCVGYHW